MATPQDSTPLGIERLVLFTDAVAAIAITLLVLPLVDVVTETVAAGEPSTEVVTAHLPEIFSFLLSFAVIARLWFVHHRLFRDVETATRAILLWNMAWVLTIVVLPFPTEMIGSYGEDPFTVALYIGTILASSVCLSVLSVLVRAAVVPGSLSATGLLLLALVLVLLVPAVSYWALLLLFLSPIADRVLARWLPPQPA